MLSQLIYVSNRNSICTDEQMEDILASCKKNNAITNITGVLLYSDTKFVQYLEGEQTDILDLYDNIKKDRRHSNAVMVSLSPVSERNFPSWQMGLKKFNEKQINFHTDMNSIEKREFQSILDGSKKQGTRALELVKKFI